MYILRSWIPKLVLEQVLERGRALREVLLKELLQGRQMGMGKQGWSLYLEKQAQGPQAQVQQPKEPQLERRPSRMTKSQKNRQHRTWARSGA